LGRAPKGPDPDRYAQRYAHCDVLVVGAGPAGLAAALAAAEAGARVILCDEQQELGGSLLAETAATIDGRPAAQWLAETVAALGRHDTVRLLPRTQAFGYFAQNFVALAERVTDHLAAPDPALPRERLWQVRAKEVVLAAGAIERPIPFPDNDRPGILLADAARTYAARYGVLPGTRAVVLAAHDSAYGAAVELDRLGVEIALIADLRRRPDGPLVEAAREAGLPIAPATTLSGTGGRLRVASVETGRVRRDGSVGSGDTVRCDLVLVGGGWTPSTHLFSQSRGRLRFDEELGVFVPGESVQRERSAGACRGVFDLAEVLADGFRAGEEAARAAGLAPRTGRTPAVEGVQPAGSGLAGAPPFAFEARGKSFVDLQNDVTTRDLEIALAEGFRSIEHVKRYTTTGMATDQGKTSNLTALALVAAMEGKAIPEVGTTTFRMPWTPVTFGTLAGPARGELFDPVRTTPIHPWAESRGAVFEDVGLWKRARYFPRGGEDMDAAVLRECAAVRGAVGVFDASTLGKIEVVGPDAATFLERMYVNAFAKLAPGRCRYGLLLNEAGYVIDDGVIARLAPDRFHVTTTTGGAARVLNLMEDYLQTEWPDLKVWLTSTTEQWAVIAVQGPKAREVLQPLVEDVDLGPQAMPHMSLREGRVAGAPARLFRVSFTGELGFEVNVPADRGRAVWEAVFGEAERRGGVAYGTEAMHVLRAEKGYVIVGQETDGTVTVGDLGLDWAIGKGKPDFVGKRSLALPDLAAPGRRQLVGLMTADPNTVLEEGAQVTAEAHPNPGTHALGHVTSSYRSAALGRSIALALVEDGRARVGQTLHVPGPKDAIAVAVVSPVFYDPEGARLHG
ncbi:MAG TPA: sarcosine oxidase subunit alpha family protein, partial [Beijerinckiaceae bacterium]|nr:sarcosine oxidase subunit alpha family protein [Beijerinckiaceae bacterium]